MIARVPEQDEEISFTSLGNYEELGVAEERGNARSLCEIPLLGARRTSRGFG